MVERFVEIDARVFLDGTLTSRRGFQLTGPGTRENLGFPGNLHLEGLRPNLSLETNELKQTKRGCALFIRKQTEPFVQKNQLATSPKQILFTGIAT